MVQQNLDMKEATHVVRHVDEGPNAVEYDAIRGHVRINAGFGGTRGDGEHRIGDDGRRGPNRVNTLELSRWLSRGRAEGRRQRIRFFRG